MPGLDSLTVKQMLAALKLYHGDIALPTREGFDVQVTGPNIQGPPEPQVNARLEANLAPPTAVEAPSPRVGTIGANPHEELLRRLRGEYLPPPPTEPHMRARTTVEAINDVGRDVGHAVAQFPLIKVMNTLGLTSIGDERPYVDPTAAYEMKIGDPGIPVAGMAGSLGQAAIEKNLPRLGKAIEAAQAGTKTPQRFAALLDRVGGKEAQQLRAMAQDTELRDVIQHLSPEEGRIVGKFDPAQQQTFGRIARWLPNEDYFGALARAGSVKLGWYLNSREAATHIFQEDTPLFTGVLAATSPQNPVETNLLNSVKIYRGWVKAGRPTDERSILRIMGENVQGTKGEKSVLDAWKANTVAVLQGKTTLSGPKVDSFWNNLQHQLGNEDRVTLDAWMSNLLGIQQSNFAGTATPKQLAAGNPGYAPGYLASSARLRRAATAAGLTPAEMQESMWSFGMALMEQAKKTGMPAREILEKGLLKDSTIKGTPDFSTLFHDPQYADVIASTSKAHADRLAALKPAPFGNRVIPERPGDKAYQLQAADKLDELLRSRRLESNLRVGTNPSPTSTIVRVPLEGVSGRKTGVAPELFSKKAGLSEGQVQNFGSSVLAPETNPRGQDIMLNAVYDQPSVESTRGTGVFKPKGGKTEFNRLLAAGAEVPLTPEGTIETQAAQAYQLVSRLKAATSGQAAAAAHALQYGGAPELQDAVHVLTPNAVKGEVLEGLSKKFPPSRYAIVNEGINTQGKAGAELDIFRLDKKPMTPREIEKIREHLTSYGEKTTPKSITPAQNIGGFYSEAPARGEGRVTKWALEHYDELPAAQKGLDTQEVKDLARRKLAAYDDGAKRLKLTIPESHRLMLQTIADGGVSALRKLVAKSPQMLPALILMGLVGGAAATNEGKDN